MSRHSAIGLFVFPNPPKFPCSIRSGTLPHGREAFGGEVWALSHQLAIPKRQSPSTGPQLAALQFADFKPFISYTFGAPATLIARC